MEKDEAAPIPTSFERLNASCFAINGLGYFGMGENYGPGTFLNDWYQYDPVANHWTSLHTFPGTKREGAASFAVDGKGYVTGGRWTGGYGVGVWQYNPANDHWTQLKDFPGAGNYIYMPATATGKIGGVDVGFVAAGQAWQYNPAKDSWFQLTGYRGSGNAPGGFVIGNSFFVCSFTAAVFSWSR
jgi:N-acetylneuraminic acid mutarotase